MKFLRKYKILLMHIALIILLLGLVVEFCEEIQTMKQAVYYRLFPEPEAEAEVEEGGRETILPDDQVVLHPVEHTGTEWYLDHPLIYHAGGPDREQYLYKFPGSCGENPAGQSGEVRG